MSDRWLVNLAHFYWPSINQLKKKGKKKKGKKHFFLFQVTVKAWLYPRLFCHWRKLIGPVQFWLSSQDIRSESGDERSLLSLSISHNSHSRDWRNFNDFFNISTWNLVGIFFSPLCAAGTCKFIRGLIGLLTFATLSSGSAPSLSPSFTPWSPLLLSRLATFLAVWPRQTQRAAAAHWTCCRTVTLPWRSSSSSSSSRSRSSRSTSCFDLLLHRLQPPWRFFTFSFLFFLYIFFPPLPTPPPQLVPPLARSPP